MSFWVEIFITTSEFIKTYDSYKQEPQTSTTALLWGLQIKIPGNENWCQIWGANGRYSRVAQKGA